MPSIFCIGASYAAHAKEMGAVAEAGAETVVFLKPWQALLAAPAVIRWPPGAAELHHEAEVVIRVGPGATVDAIALGLDLTDRPRQVIAKKAGLPWARAKGFFGSAPVGAFVPVAAVPPLDALKFTLAIDGKVVQRGDTSLLLRSIPALLADLDATFRLRAGDLVFTGTPEGVGPIAPGQTLDLAMDDVPGVSARFTVGPK